MKPILHSSQNHTKTPPKKGNYRPMALMNTNAKLLNKIMANQIPQHSRKIIHDKDAGMFQHMKIYKCNTAH
jgi:hypothetical protein